MWHGSAATKCILFGEHVGAYGGSALAVPLKKHRTHVSLQVADTTTWQSNYPLSGSAAQHALHCIEQALGWTLPAFAVSVQCGVPPGCGGGMSASLVLALVRALSHWNADGITEQKMHQILAITEQEFHGKSSGIDARTIATEVPQLLHQGQFYSLPNVDIMPQIVSTGTPQQTTAQMVQHVQTWRTAHPKKFLAIVAASQTMGAQILHESTENLHEIIHTWSAHLVSLGIVSPAAAALCASLQGVGYAAKITGAGGLEQSGMVCVLGTGNGTLDAHVREHSFQLL